VGARSPGESCGVAGIRPQSGLLQGTKVVAGIAVGARSPGESLDAEGEKESSKYRPPSGLLRLI
jgi:hypothetical protein